jgi:tetratricopeptide (TPR) repeat protein
MSSTIDEQRLARLLGFLDRDPDNKRLLQDAAEAAYAAGELDRAIGLIARIGTPEALPPEAANLSGLIAIAQGRYGDAVNLFTPLHQSQPATSELSFNLAWAHAMLGEHEHASELLDAGVIRAVPRAAALKVRMLHHLERYDDALALGETLVERQADAPGLSGVLAILALDAERPDLARRYAEASPGDGQALAALGTLALVDDDTDTAARLFEEAIVHDPRSPRAWVGKGLTLMAEQKPAEALPALDRGATLFGDHIGSWIAAGWAHFVAGDANGARERFERD